MDRKEILSQVAAGTLSPEEASEQLDALDQPQQRTPGPEEPESGEPVHRVRISKRLGMVDVIGDPTIEGARAEGGHTARRTGDLLLIDADEIGGDRSGFRFHDRRHERQSETGPWWREGWWSATWWQHPWWAEPRGLVVRSNPQLGLEVSLQGGSCRVGGMTGPLKLELQAGSAKIAGFLGPLDLTIQAGSLKAVGRLDSGTSTIHCDAGSARILLQRGSSVRVIARSSLGKVALPGNEGWDVGGKREAVVGDGAGTLEIDSSMGSVEVALEP
jgi:hypothetical protein